MDTTDIPKAVKEAVQRVDPTAETILFGSRARGDGLPDSDWDFLLLFDEEPSEAVRRDIDENLLDIELETGAVICALRRTKSEWNASISRATPLHESVLAEGITL